MGIYAHNTPSPAKAGEGIVQPWMKIQDKLSRRLHQYQPCSMIEQGFFLLLCCAKYLQGCENGDLQENPQTLNS